MTLTKQKEENKYMYSTVEIEMRCLWKRVKNQSGQSGKGDFVNSEINLSKRLLCNKWKWIEVKLCL